MSREESQNDNLDEAFLLDETSSDSEDQSKSEETCFIDENATESFLLDSSSCSDNPEEIEEKLDSDFKEKSAATENIPLQGPRMRLFDKVQLDPSKDKDSPSTKVCSRSCRYNCSDFLRTLDADTLAKIKNLFNKSNLLETKNALLNHIKHQVNNMGKTGQAYFVHGSFLCIGAFCSLTDISRHISLKVLVDFKDGCETYVHGNFGIRKVTIKTEKFISWMKAFLYLYSQSDPEKQVQVLNHWLTKTQLYSMYCSDTTKSFQLAKSSFYQHIHNYFGPNRVDKSFPQVRGISNDLDLIVILRYITCELHTQFNFVEV